MAITYEWVVEELNGDDVGETHFADSVEEVSRYVPDEGEWRLGVVRDVFRSDGALIDRQWAYMQSNGKLPALFDGGAAIPTRIGAQLSISVATRMLAP